MISSTVWANKSINLAEDNSGDTVQTNRHLLPFAYNLQLYGFHYPDKL